MVLLLFGGEEEQNIGRKMYLKWNKLALIGLFEAVAIVAAIASGPSPIRAKLNELKLRIEFRPLFQVFEWSFEEFARKAKRFLAQETELATAHVIAKAHKNRDAKGLNRRASFDQLYDEIILKPCESIRSLRIKFEQLVRKTMDTSPSARKLNRANDYCEIALEKETRNICFDQFKLELKDATFFV